MHPCSNCMYQAMIEDSQEGCLCNCLGSVKTQTSGLLNQLSHTTGKELGVSFRYSGRQETKLGLHIEKWLT